jgi:hypothetical protein
MKRLLLATALAFLALPAFAQLSPSLITTIAVSVGMSHGQVSGQHFRSYLSLINVSATATIACRLDGTAAVIGAAGTIPLPPLAAYNFDGGVIPGNAIDCIASAPSTPLTVLENG